MGGIHTGAGEGDRTLVVSLENFCSTIELHPQAFLSNNVVKPANTADSDLILVEGEGFEPSYSERADLQSAAFNHSATPPKLEQHYSNNSTPCQLFFAILTILFAFYTTQTVHVPANLLQKPALQQFSPDSARPFATLVSGCCASESHTRPAEKKTLPYQR